MKSKNSERGENSENLLVQEPYQGFLVLRKSIHTQTNYHQDLRVFKQYLDSVNLSSPVKVGPADLTRFVGQLVKPGKTPTGFDRLAYSTRSLKRILASLRSFYRYLAATQQITTDPTIIFHNFAIRSPQRNPRPLAPQDRVALIQSLKTDSYENQRVSLSILFGYHCGLRVSEISNLRRRDLDLTRGLVTVIGKGDKERTIPMTEALQQLLKEFLKQSENDNPYIFPSPRTSQRPIHIRYLENWVKKAASWAGLEAAEELTVHVLRHSFGTQLAESGASVYEIRDLMGHSSIVVSENYVKLASTKARQAHGKAFGTGMKVHSVKLLSKSGPEEILRRFRSLAKKAQKDSLEEA